MVSSEMRADTMATYLEAVQWRVRPATVINHPCLGPPLPVSTACFSYDETASVLKKLRRGKAPGLDGLPAEYFKALLSNEEAVAYITDLANACLDGQVVPEEWHTARVSAIYKKGRVDLCENYRPMEAKR